MNDKIEINLNEIISFIKRYYYITLATLILSILVLFYSPFEFKNSKPIIFKYNIVYNILDDLSFERFSKNIKSLNRLISTCKNLEIYFAPGNQMLDDTNNDIKLRLMDLYSTCGYLSQNSFAKIDAAKLMSVFERMIRNKIVNIKQIKMSKDNNFGEISLFIENDSKSLLEANIKIINKIENQLILWFNNELQLTIESLLQIDNYTKKINNEKIELTILNSLLTDTINGLNNSQIVNFNELIAKDTEFVDNDVKKVNKEQSLYLKILYALIIGLLLGISLSILIGYIFKSIVLVK